MSENELNPQAEGLNEEVNQESAADAPQEPVAEAVAPEETPVEPVVEEAPVAEPEPAPEAAPAEKPAAALAAVKEEVLNRRADLSDDLEAELNAAMAGADVDALMAESVVAAPEMEVGAKVAGKVTQISGEDVFVELPGNVQAFIPAKQFGETLPEVGAEVKAKVAKDANADGLWELALPGAAQDVADWSEVQKGMVVEVTITAHNAGGLECKVNRLRGFIPASQVANYRVDNLEELVGQKMECLITEVNPARKNLVLSRRAIMDKEREALRDELIQKLAPGQVYDGVVRKIMDFGAFVDIGGIDGLLHISQLSWDRVKHPSDVLTEGQEIRVQVEKIDPKTKKISFAYRDMQENPWANVETEFPVGSEVTGKVSKIMGFGAFVVLKPGVEGLVHISEISHQRIGSVEEALKVGDEVTAKVLEVNKTGRRISLSLKALTDAPPKRENDAKQDRKPAEEHIVKDRPKPSGPLRGGVGGDTGGGLFN